MHDPAYVHSCLSTVWPFRTLPAVLTLVCVDSKHSCRSQRPRSGRTRGSEGQWQREGREGAGRQEVERGIRRERVCFSDRARNKEEEVVGNSQRFLFWPSTVYLCRDSINLKGRGSGRFLNLY